MHTIYLRDPLPFGDYERTLYVSRYKENKSKTAIILEYNSQSLSIPWNNITVIQDIK